MGSGTNGQGMPQGKGATQAVGGQPPSWSTMGGGPTGIPMGAPMGVGAAAPPGMPQSAPPIYPGGPPVNAPVTMKGGGPPVNAPPVNAGGVGVAAPPPMEGIQPPNGGAGVGVPSPGPVNNLGVPVRQPIPAGQQRILFGNVGNAVPGMMLRKVFGR